MVKESFWTAFTVSTVLAVGLFISGVSAQSDEVDREAEMEELLRAQQVTGSGFVPAIPEKIGEVSKAEAFVAGPNWEFDGFVAGGQDSRIKSMYVINDLVYLNIGYSQGLRPGQKVSIFRRGNKVNDPQSRKFIGYEVRRAAIGSVTDKVESETSVVRIEQSYEAVEIGDLVRLND